MKEHPGSFDYALFANTDGNHPAADVFTTSPLEAAGPAALELGTWTHLALTWDGATLKLFVDGANVATQAAPAPLMTSTGQLRIGGSSLGGQFFNGLIDEVRVYDRPLAGSAIQADMNAPVKPGTP